MNYLYIEQLLERYFDCQTTLQEEQILRSFFSQEDVPGHLLQYVELFKYEAEAANITLGNDFDQRMLNMIEAENESKSVRVVKMRPRRLAPFFKAAAVVAVAITIGNATEHAIGVQQAEEYSNGNAVAVDPYIKSSDISSAIRVKDVSRAENNAVTDSIINSEEIQ